MIYRPILTIFLTILFMSQIDAQPAKRGVFVDENGVMKWEDTQQEIKGFGVNYTVPFAHAYRSAKKLGIDPLQAIDEDVYHFSRLGFDLYRVHVWDTEISDTLGNLIFNEHLHAFDYLLKKLGERNINYVLTPIAFWGNGWPEPDEATPGFSAKYGKDNCLTNPKAIQAQENYLSQFMNHINPYTGIAYKDDPRLIAIEISNEPHHREAPEQVTAFIQRMVNAVRKTGYEKPIFYNISHSVHLAEDYFKADIQGGTFQWYPTGLGYQRELPGNFLPNVDHYDIPFEKIIKENKGAKIVYEFDAADIGQSYIYPAMARSFRMAGIQLATHFSYDPLFLAPFNTEYNTHYMNLAYAPQKALSLKICSEVFHEIPMYKDFGKYPDNISFDQFSVDYEKNLALFNSGEKYFYTNHTDTQPTDPSALSQIAGYGNSPVIKYDGTGAYFLDKLENGIWRLEIMPDALIIDNPYGRNSLNKKVAVVQWNKRKMKINLNDLGSTFTITPINQENNYTPEISEGSFLILPGTYLITKTGKINNWKAEGQWQQIKLNEFHAPKNSVDKTYLVHKKAEAVSADEPLLIEAQAISPNPDISLQIQVTSGDRWQLIDMERTAGFSYQAFIPKEKIKSGFLTYYIYVKNKNSTETFPAGQLGLPYDWDFYDRTPYTLRVIDKTQPIYLFNAETDWSHLSFRWWSRDSKLIPTNQINESEYQIHLNSLIRNDEENLNAPIIPDYTLRHYLNEKINHQRGQLKEKKKLVLKARSLKGKTSPIQVALVTKDGNAYGKIIELNPVMTEHEILLSDLKKINTVTMPRPYPTFLPYYFSPTKNDGFKVADIEFLQISVGPGLAEEALDQEQKIGIVSLRLE
ncbi:MAG: hypothetical protein R2788_13775 [Saprospiraceae bacterium]